MERSIPELIAHTCKEYNTDSTLPLNIAWCESNFNPSVKNASSTATGIFQFLESTWEENCVGDVLDPIANIRCGVRLISSGGVGAWQESYSCWRYLPYKFPEL